jgi:hypothetical protein
MLYSRCTGIYRFENNTYPQCIRCRWNVGHIFWGKGASYGPGNMITQSFWLMQCTEIKGVATSLIMIKVMLTHVCHEGIEGD